MSVNKEEKGNVPRPVLPSDANKQASKATDFERIRQNLVKRSLKVKFDLEGSQYKSIENIGAGAYGVVCSAVNKKTGDRVAIKKTSHVFEVLTIAKRTYREIRILKHFKHDNIIKIRDILLPKEDVKTFADIYIVFDLMESDLHHIIYSQQALSEEHIRYFLYQILRGLKYIHSANVVHRDLKPSNLLVNEDCHLRIGDFGMARGITYMPDEPNYLMTQYVATRWYRAPEILLSMIEYGTAVDMWSVGCIFAEMIGRKHLFPGKDYMSQVKLILGVLGTPSEVWMKNCQNDILKRIIKSLGIKPAEPWQKIFPNASRKSIDLLSKMLVLNPAERISVDQALGHRLLNHYHDPDDEPICVPAFNFDFENEEMNMSQLRTASMKEIMDFHQPKPPTLSFPALLRPAPKDSGSGDSISDDSKDNIVKKKDIVFTAIDKEEPELKPIVPDASSYGGKPDQLSQSTKASPVFVDTSKSQLDAPLSDIEMLSAKSNSGMMDLSTKLEQAVEEEKQQDVAVAAVVTTELPDKKETKPAADKKGGNTISEDTKALVKQALLNATQRRQREPKGEETEKAKPVTAAQRQKEREEKRKKKKERAMEKGKKAKSKAAVPEKQHINLSNEDLEMLRRWTSMQFPTHPMKDGSGGAGNASDPSASPPHNINTNNNTITISTTTNPDSTISLTMIPSNSLPQPQTQKSSSNGGFAIKNSKKFRQILSKSSVPSTNQQQQSSSNVNVTSSQTFNSGSVMLSSSQLNNLSMSNFIPVIAIPSTTNPGNVEIKRILPPPLQTTAASSSALVSTHSSTSHHATASILPTLESIKADLQKGIIRRASGSNVNTQQPSTTTNTSSSTSIPSQFPPSGQERFQSLFHHHRHSTGSMQQNPREATTNMDTTQVRDSTDKSQCNVRQDIQYRPPMENPELNFVSNLNNQFKEARQMTPPSMSQQSVTAGVHTGKPHSPDILELLQQSPTSFSALIERQPQQNVGDNSSQLNINTNSTSPPPPPPYPFHRSPQQIQSSSPSPNHNLSFSVENSPQGFSFSPTSFGTYQSNSPGNSNDGMSRPFLTKHHSEPQIMHNLFRADSSHSQSEFNIQTPPFVGSSSDDSRAVSSSSTPFFDHSMDHQQSHAIPFQNYQNSHHHHHHPHHPQQQQQQHQNVPVQYPQLPHQQQQNVDQEQQLGLYTDSHRLPSFHVGQQNSTNFNTTQTSSSLPSSSSASSYPTYINPEPTASPPQHHHHQYQQHNNVIQQQPFHQLPQQQQQQGNHYIQQQQSQHNQFHHQQQQQQQPQQQGPFPAFTNAPSPPMFPQQSSPQQHPHLLNTQSSHAGPSHTNTHLTPSTSGVYLSTNPNGEDSGFGGSSNPSTSGHKSKSPQLTIDTQKDKRGDGADSTSNPQDLIAMLTKQLSKSAVVVDSYPPALALTPKGTGAGYGVGMDLDAMLTDAQDVASMRVEQSPLSSSLIADWLAVSGAISQADIEALEREFVLPSPMNVSYNDVHFHH